jgi:hypothetical protein
MWWSKPKVYIRVVIYLAILAVVWFKIRPIMQIGVLPIEANLTDMVEVYVYQDTRAEPGMKYMSIGFYLEASDDGELELNEDRFRLVERSGRVYPPVDGSLDLPEVQNLLWRFQSGDVCAGRVVFLVHEEARPTRLSINPRR